MLDTLHEEAIEFMSEQETQRMIGADGLVEFGEYLTGLNQPDYRDYTFEMPTESGTLRKCSLDDVLARFKEFFDGKTDTFRVGITYVDYRHGTLGRSDRTFSRRKQ